MLYSLAIVLALAMVLCMVPVSFAASTINVSAESYDLAVAALDATGAWPSSLSEEAGWTIKNDTNSITFKYNYEDLSEVTTGKFTENRKMAAIRIGGLQGNFTSVDEIKVDGKLLEVNELADYFQRISDNYKWAVELDAIFIPVELTKAGYSDTYLIEINGKALNAQNEAVDATETIKISVTMENTSSYKPGKTATISKIESNDRGLDAYIVGSKIYLDFVNQKVPVDDGVTITFKDDNGDAFDVVTWAYETNYKDKPAKGTEGAWIYIGKEEKLSDSAATYSIGFDGNANKGKEVSFKLETASSIYETKEYDIVVRENIKETDPKGIYFAENSKTIAIGEEYTPVVYGIATGKKLDAKIDIGTVSGTTSGAVNAQYVDVTDGETVIGTQEGVAYITASYTTNDGKTYTASSMKITVTAKGATDDDDDKDGKTYMVTASSLRVRSGAGTNFSQIGSLKNGATVKVESIANGWAKLENGGYVSAQYLAKVVDNGEAQTMYVTARTLNVRKGPGTSYAKVGTLSRGTAVQVVGFSGNWAKLSNGYYVSTSYLAK